MSLISVLHAMAKSQFLIKPNILQISGILTGCRYPLNQSKSKSMNNVF